MYKRYDQLNRQARRSIDSFQDTLLELMNKQPYETITITDLARCSGLTRSTFYAHFETKDQLLESVIHGLLDEFFDESWEFCGDDAEPSLVLESYKAFFRVWEKHRDLIPLQEFPDFDCLLVDRLRECWEKLDQINARSAQPEIEGSFFDYALNFLAYSFTGFLKEWIRQDMKPSPEIMGEMLYHFTSRETMLAAREKFNKKIG